MSAAIAAGASGAAGVLTAYASGELGKAAAIQQQAGMLLQARDNLAIAEVRADYSEQYAAIQSGRTLKKAEIEATNYKIAGNQLLRNLRSANASARARAAANGVQLGSGSIEAIQRENTAATMRDVQMADFNALSARVFGFEDASAMMESNQIQNIMDLYASRANLKQAEIAGAAGVKQAGLLANAQLANALISGAQNTPSFKSMMTPTKKAP
jgi:predicted XRE-type DNA-binding protein